jgi:phosphatidylglycerophosphatase A
MININSRDVFSHPAFFLATGFGIGLIPFAPGTWGSLLGILIYLALHALGLTSLWELLIILLFFFLALWACNVVLEKRDVHDPPALVIDETVAMMLLLVTIPITTVWVIVAFLTFRVLDIFKPWPISTVDAKIKTGLGVMLDDLVAVLIGGFLIFIVRLLL